MWDILKNCKTQVGLFQWDYMIVVMKIGVKMKNGSHRYDINRTRPRHGYEYTNIKCVSVWWCLCSVSYTLATSEAEFLKNLSNTDAELKESVVYCLMFLRSY